MSRKTKLKTYIYIKKQILGNFCVPKIEQFVYFTGICSYQITNWTGQHHWIWCPQTQSFGMILTRGQAVLRAATDFSPPISTEWWKQLILVYIFTGCSCSGLPLGLSCRSAEEHSYNMNLLCRVSFPWSQRLLQELSPGAVAGCYGHMHIITEVGKFLLRSLNPAVQQNFSFLRHRFGNRFDWGHAVGIHILNTTEDRRTLQSFPQYSRKVDQNSTGTEMRHMKSQTGGLGSGTGLILPAKNQTSIIHMFVYLVCIFLLSKWREVCGT